MTRGFARAAVRTFEREHVMLKQFSSGFLMTLATAAIIALALVGIFTLVSYLAGPVGG